MKVLIEIDSVDYEVIKEVDELGGSWKTDIASQCMKAIANATPIPDNPTNGDVIQTLFPNIDIRLFTDANIVQTKIQEFDSYWWNAPYDAESEVD